jgi:ubiquinol-cytochrome c reductase cytochrome b subunit
VESVDKIEFHKEFTNKDSVYIILLLFMFLMLISNCPNTFMDPENMNEANPIKAPVHIQPEWYFLFAYAILRSIPSKLGGIVALALSVLLFYTVSFKSSRNCRGKFSPALMVKTLIFFSSFLVLTFVGSKPVENPYSPIGKITRAFYFMFFLY